MIDAATYLEHIRRDGARIPEVAEGHFDAPVPSCPGMNVGALLLHTASLYIFWSEAIRQNKQPEIDWSVMNTDVLAGNREGLERFVELLSSRRPDEPTWTWEEYTPGLPPGRMRFWYRRAAQELAVHRWDFENAVGKPSPIEPALAADGIDELLTAFGPATGHEQFRGASERFEGNGETFALVPNDGPDAITFTARPDRFDLDGAADADVTARGEASDLLLFLWGRVPRDAFEVSGDASLLDRWQEKVKI